MGPTWVLSAPGGPHVGPMNLPIRVINSAAVPVSLADEKALQGLVMATC